MKAATYKIDQQGNVVQHLDPQYEESETQLVLGFGAKSLISDNQYFEQIKEKFPKADIILGSTSGEIFQDEVNDNTICLAAIKFDNTPFKSLEINVKDFESAYQIGQHIYEELKADDLKYIYLLADGSEVHASDLINGINHNNKVKITGGLAGDGVEFRDTKVGLNGTPEGVKVVAIGFYGDAIRVAQGSFGGWEEFGLSRVITKSKNNELFEVDGQNILDLYKRYLGKYAEELPASALLFPLSLQRANSEDKVVRTILSLDEDSKSLIFAGDMPEGSTVRLMKANKDSLIDAARRATEEAVELCDELKPKLAILISCVGRKLVLNQRVDEEIDEVINVLGKDTPITGYYSYGEISPLSNDGKCQLHNQTMTITLFDEVS